MINLIFGIAFGILVGASIGALAFDPCDTLEKRQQLSPRESLQYNPDDDAAMQFKWKDHQPTLRSR